MTNTETLSGTLERGLAILDHFAKVGEASPGDIATALGLSRSSTYRLMDALREKGLLEQSPDSERFRLGFRAAQLGMAALSQIDVTGIAPPYLRALAGDTLETVFLAVVDHDEVVYVHQEEGPQAIKLTDKIGNSRPLHCTALGKAFMSALPKDTRRALVDRLDLRRFTENTITDPVKLADELDRTLDRGYAIDNAEGEEGVVCFAAPVLNHHGAPVAAISVSGPEARIRRNEEKIVRSVVHTAGAISGRLGYLSRPAAPEASTQYFHTISSASGYTDLRDEACDLLGFAKLSLAQGETYEGNTGSREALLVVLSGKCDVTVGNRRFESVGRRASVFAGNPHSVYVPRGSAYRVTAHSRLEVAIPSAPSDLDTAPYEIAPEGVNTGQWGTLNYTRYFREILVEPDGRPARRLIVGETITPSGNWSTYPPHRHDRADPAGQEVAHEEMYYFKIDDPGGFGLIRHYSSEGDHDTTYTVRDETLLSIPHGYHTYVGAPGYTSYYLWFLAGEGRTQRARLDPNVGWAQKVVRMA